MTATPYLLQLADPDQSPAASNGIDSMIVIAESSADALAFAQNFVPKKVWAAVTPATLAEATDMTGWSMRVSVQKVSDGSITIDQTVTNAGQLEKVVLASQVLTSSENYADTDTVTIGSRVYTFQASLTAVDGNVLVAGSEAATILNLVHAINNSGGVPGTDYFVTAADPHVTAVAAAHTATVTALASLSAAAANAVATTASMHAPGNGAWGNTTLLGGVDSTNKLSSLADLMVAVLTGLGYHAGFVNSTHILTVSSIADNIGDHRLDVYVTPPNASEQISPVGVQTRNGVSIPGMVSTIVDLGSAGAVLTVTLVADTYGVPAMILKARALTQD